MGTMKRKPKNRLKGRTKTDTDHSPTSLEDLQHTELSGGNEKGMSLDSSSTDENEDEGFGDGNIGRSTNDILRK